MMCSYAREVFPSLHALIKQYLAYSLIDICDTLRHKMYCYFCPCEYGDQTYVHVYVYACIHVWHKQCKHWQELK